jgi:hypothetical protein
MALVRERDIPTERPPLVEDVSANFRGYRVLRGQRNGFPRPYSRISEWTLPQTHHFSENLVAPEIEHGTSGSVARTTWSQRRSFNTPLAS